MTKRLLVAAGAFALFAVVPLAVSGAAPVNYNDPAYWETQTEHESICYKHEAGSETGHGVDNGDGSVTLNPYDPSWPGDHWELVVVKGGSVDNGYGPGNAAYFHPEAGVPYFAPLNAGGEQADVSHWVACKGFTPDETTTTTTTTEPPTTTVTEPPTTTTTTIPEETTTTTTVTEPPTTTEPPDDLEVLLSCDFENRDADTGAHEPIISIWNFTDGTRYPFGEYSFTFVAYDRDGNLLGAAEEFSLPTPGRHDSWVGPEDVVPVPDDGFTFDFLINGVVVETVDDPDCRKETPPETTATTLPVCYDDDGDGVKTYQRDYGDHKKGDICELANTGGPIETAAIASAGLLLAGLLSLAIVRAWPRLRRELDA